jgi:hypothetical protein
MLHLIISIIKKSFEIISPRIGQAASIMALPLNGIIPIEEFTYPPCQDIFPRHCNNLAMNIQGDHRIHLISIWNQCGAKVQYI